MRVTYDKSANAVYIYVKAPIKAGEAVKQVVVDSKDNIILDFDKKGKLLGVEVLDACETLSPELLRNAEQL